jgi:sigma-B regulation protein RsbU (phosphoserine phosphatase)
VTPAAVPAAWRDAVAELVEGGHRTGPADLAALVSAAATKPAATISVYLTDYQQRTLRPLSEGAGESIDGSPAGLAFTTLRAVRADGPAPRFWVPIVNGTERLGVVLAGFDDGADPASELAGCRLFAGMVGHLITAKSQYGDHLERVRRSRPMTPAAELLWSMLPPLTFATPEAIVTAILEPCYEVGGDAFDYSVDGPTVRLAVYDAAGKGMRAALTTATTLGAVRTTRRTGGDLASLAAAADRAIRSEFDDARFVTAVLADLDLRDGRLRYVNAGHPAPVLFRDGSAAEVLGQGRRPPLGVEPGSYQPAELRFRPGDRLLLHTDGVTEARDVSGTQFGLDRLVALAEDVSREDLPAPEMLRALAHTVVDRQAGPPRDDATLVLVEWSAAAADRAVP